MLEEQKENIVNYIQDKLLLEVLKGGGFHSYTNQGKYHLFTFFLKEPRHINSLFSDLKRIELLKEVYYTHLTETKEKGRQFCFYSTLGSTFIFKIHAKQLDVKGSLCEELFVTAYDSLDEMIIDLGVEIHNQKYLGKVISSIKYEELLYRFIKSNPDI